MKMKPRRAITAVATALVLSAGSSAALAQGHHGRGHEKGKHAGSVSSLAQKQCRQELKKMGRTNFRSAYGGTGAFGRCVSHRVRQDAVDQQASPQNSTALENQQVQAEDNAAQQCRAEEESTGSDAFAQEYGTNPNKANAFGKCVSGKAQKQEEQSGSDESTSGSDETTSGSDESTSGSDETTSGSDESTSGSDESTTGSDSSSTQTTTVTTQTSSS